MLCRCVLGRVASTIDEEETRGREGGVKTKIEYHSRHKDICYEDLGGDSEAL